MLLLNDKTIETCWILVSLLEHKDNHGIGILSWRGQSQSWEILSHWIVNQLIAITTININNFLFSADSGRSWPLSGGGAWSRWAGPGAGADTGPLTPPGAAAGARRSSGGSSTGAHSAGTRGYTEIHFVILSLLASDRPTWIIRKRGLFCYWCSGRQ